MTSRAAGLYVVFIFKHHPLVTRPHNWNSAGLLIIFKHHPLVTHPHNLNGTHLLIDRILRDQILLKLLPICAHLLIRNRILQDRFLHAMYQNQASWPAHQKFSLALQDVILVLSDTNVRAMSLIKSWDTDMYPCSQHHANFWSHIQPSSFVDFRFFHTLGELSTATKGHQIRGGRLVNVQAWPSLHWTHLKWHSWCQGGWGLQQRG